MKKLCTFTIFISLICLLLAKEQLHIPKLHTPPIIDGKISSNEWDEAILRNKFFQTAPGDNTEPSEKTEFYLGYDDKNIYALAKCFMKDKTLIRDFHCRRDAIYTTDRVFLFLDTFHSNDRAYYVVANANGEQADGIIIENIDTTIDFYFESMGSRTDYGWLVEIAIPLKSLKYKSGRSISWGGFLKRVIPERNEEITSFPVKRGGGNFYDNYGIFKFEELPTNKNLKFIPSAIGSFSKNTVSSADTLGNYIESSSSKKEFEQELNILYEPNSNLTMTATINPDFNIIEADGLNVEMNLRYPIYYAEKRPFFIEETNPYQTDINIFHTRRIIDPKYGAKLSGLFGKTNVFALGALDEKAEGSRFGFDKTADTPFLFASLNRKFRAGNSFLRAAGTFRKFKEYENYVFSLDTNHRFLDLFNCDGQAAVSSNEVEDETGEIVQKKGYAHAFDLDFYNSRWFINFETKAITGDFAADLGFVTETDINFFTNRTEYQIRAKTDRDLIRYMEFASTQNIKFDYKFNDIKSFYWEVMNGGIFKNTFEYWTGFEYQMENYLGEDFYMYYPWLVLEYEPLKQLWGTFLIVDGRNLFFGYDKGEYGDYYKYETTLFFRPTNNIDIEFKQRYHETEKFYIARTYETKLKLQFHKNFWIRVILQLTNNDIMVDDYCFQRINLYPLFTYKPSSNTAVYLGASNGWYDEDYEGEIWDTQNQQYLQKILRFQENNMTYYLKVSYTFDVL